MSTFMPTISTLLFTIVSAKPPTRSVFAPTTESLAPKASDEKPPVLLKKLSTVFVPRRPDPPRMNVQVEARSEALAERDGRAFGALEAEGRGLLGAASAGSLG